MRNWRARLFEFDAILYDYESYCEGNQPEEVETVSVVVQESGLVSGGNLVHVLVVDDVVR